MAVPKTFEELEKQLETVMEELVKDRHDNSNKEVINNACLILQAMREKKQQAYVEVDEGNATLKTPASNQASEFDKVVQWLKYGDQSVKPEPPKMTWEEMPKVPVDKNLQTLGALVDKLPTDSVAEDENIVRELFTLTSKPTYSAILLGRRKWDINKLLNTTTIKRSYSKANLQAHMAATLVHIAFDDVSRISIVQKCPHTMPFLIKCLRSPTPDIRNFSAIVVSGLSTVDSIRKKIGESGAIMALLELIQRGDQYSTFEANEAILNLCSQNVENRERAVSDGAVSIVIAKIKKGFLVLNMLLTLEMLSWNEKAIAELEENGMFESLFTIMEGANWGMIKAYCMLILHKMCHLTPAKTSRIDKVENGRKILQSVASRGTTKAREKASDLLWRLSLLDEVHSK